MSRLTRDGMTEPVSRDQILRRERGQGNISFSCSADHEQDWQPYPVGSYPCYDDHTYSKLCMLRKVDIDITGRRTEKIALNKHSKAKQSKAQHSTGIDCLRGVY